MEKRHIHWTDGCNFLLHNHDIFLLLAIWEPLVANFDLGTRFHFMKPQTSWSENKTNRDPPWRSRVHMSQHRDHNRQPCKLHKMIVSSLLVHHTSVNLCWNPDHSLTICWPFADHLLTICWPFVDHLLTIFWLFVDHLLTICWLFADHSLTICWQFVDHLLTICWLFADHLLTCAASSEEGAVDLPRAEARTEAPDVLEVMMMVMWLGKHEIRVAFVQGSR